MKADKDRCLTEQEMMHYIRGSSDKAEQRRVELHISDCELCADAIEGMKLLGSGHAEIVTSLRHKLNKKIAGRKARTLSFEWWQIAAMVAIIAIGAGTYVYISTFSEETIAISALEKEEKKEQQNTAVAAPEKVKDAVEQIEQPAATENKSVPPAAVIPAQEAAENASGMHEQELSGDKEAASTMTENADAPTAFSGNRQVEMTEDVSLQSAAGTVKAESRKPSETAPGKVISSSPLIPDSTGLALYRNKQYIEAVDLLKKAPSTHQRNYYLAASYFELGRNKDAMFYFDKILSDRESSFYDDALWYKAQILIKEGNKVKARKVLQEIVKSDSPHREEAGKMIDNLE